MNPFDHYRQVRDQQINWGPGLRLPRHPFVNIYQPLQALRALTALPDLRFAKALAPSQSESGEAPLCQAPYWPAGRFPNLAVSCQLSLLWTLLSSRLEDAPLASAAKRLSGFLSPMIEEGLTTLWTSEREYRPEETALSFDLFLRAIGKPFHAERLASIGEEGFFPFLYRSDLQLHPETEVLSDPELGYELFRRDGAAWAFTSKGWQTPAGALRIGDVEIPSFGPHLAPLSDPLLFGIGPGDKEWFCSFADKESWFRIEPTSSEGSHASFWLHSARGPSEQPLSFAFYVRADECSVGGRTYKPKSLQRFCSEAQKVEFSTRQTNISLSVDRPLKIEVIPLAGGAGFWGASFLTAIWLPPSHSKIHFQIGASI